MKRTVHSGNDSGSWGSPKLSNFGAEQAKPVSGKPEANRVKGLGHAPVMSTKAKANKIRTPS